jgi:hypothetical protein
MLLLANDIRPDTCPDQPQNGKRLDARPVQRTPSGCFLNPDSGDPPDPVETPARIIELGHFDLLSGDISTKSKCLKAEQSFAS